MAESTIEDRKDHVPNHVSNYISSRNENEVLIGDDVAYPIMEASSSGNAAALQDMLSQQKWNDVLLQSPVTIYKVSDHGQDQSLPRTVSAQRTWNLGRALKASYLNNQPATASILIEYFMDRGYPAFGLVDRPTLEGIIRHGYASLLYPIAAKWPEVVECDIGHGRLPLHTAVIYKQPEVVRVLLELGADPLRRSKLYKSSILSSATMYHDLSMMKMLVEHGVPVEPSRALHTAAYHGLLDQMRYLIENGTDVNRYIGPDGLTPLLCAASQGKVDAMKLLEENGARLDLKDPNMKTPYELLEEYKAAHDSSQDA